MLGANGDSERPGITFTACELDGFSSMLIAADDNIDAVRDTIGTYIIQTSGGVHE